VTDVRAHHWFFGFAHDAWKVGTSRVHVESIDGMELMSRLDSRGLSATGAANPRHSGMTSSSYRRRPCFRTVEITHVVVSRRPSDVRIPEVVAVVGGSPAPSTSRDRRCGPCSRDWASCPKRRLPRSP
jgi:hypothetical protein